MKNFFILFILFELNNVYAESGKYSCHSICDYDEYEINSNNNVYIL